MLATPPPGANPATINQQTIPPFTVPGQQGGPAQGYLYNPYRSSYTLPSSYSTPSSVDVPNQYYQNQQQKPNNAAAMIQALLGGR